MFAISRKARNLDLKGIRDDSEDNLPEADGSREGR